MTEDARSDAPPAGEQIHVPAPSLLPVVLAVGRMLALVGVTVSVILTVAGLVIAVPTLVIWIRSSREELSELPPGH